MRLHIVGLPYSRSDYAAFDGFSAKVRDLACTFPDSYLYWTEPNSTPATLVDVRCPDVERVRPVAHHWEGDTAWQAFEYSVLAELLGRVEPGDFICLPVGTLLTHVIEAFPGQCVETGIGYAGVAAPHRVYESYAWLHYLAGRDDRQCAWFDAVIPPMIRGYETDDGRESFEFDPPGTNRPHIIFAGRAADDKGGPLAREIAERSGIELVDIGSEAGAPLSRYAWLAELHRADAVLVPTYYVEPFGRIFAEALCVGTPVITTDWGAFTEYVEQGVDGYRCRSMAEFVDATKRVRDLDRPDIAGRARARFNPCRIRGLWEDYFTRLSTLWGDGFYA